MSASDTNTPAKLAIIDLGSRNYQGVNALQALEDIERIKALLRNHNPSFLFANEKGDIAEAYAADVFDLIPAPRGIAGYDLLTRAGLKVSVKNLWEINSYRGLALSGGTNQKPYAYRDADHLLAFGRDEFTDAWCILYNGPMTLLEPYIKGDSRQPRIDVRALRKANAKVGASQKLVPAKACVAHADPFYYPKDLALEFGVDASYWQKFRMLWNNYPSRYNDGVTLNDFLDYGIRSAKSGAKSLGVEGEERISGDPLLSRKDMDFLVKCYEFYLSGHDHHTSAYAAYASMTGFEFPDLIRVTAAGLSALGIPSSTLYRYSSDPEISPHFSHFFSAKSYREGGRALDRYFSPHDLKIFMRAYELRGRKNPSARGGSSDAVGFLEAGRQAATEAGRAPAYPLPDPRLRGLTGV